MFSGMGDFHNNSGGRGSGIRGMRGMRGDDEELGDSEGEGRDEEEEGSSNLFLSKRHSFCSDPGFMEGLHERYYTQITYVYITHTLTHTYSNTYTHHAHI